MVWELCSSCDSEQQFYPRPREWLWRISGVLRKHCVLTGPWFFQIDVICVLVFISLEFTHLFTHVILPRIGHSCDAPGLCVLCPAGVLALQRSHSWGGHGAVLRRPLVPWSTHWKWILLWHVHWRQVTREYSFLNASVYGSLFYDYLTI